MISSRLSSAGTRWYLSRKLGGVPEVARSQPFPVRAGPGGRGGCTDPGLLLWSSEQESQPSGAPIASVSLRSRVQGKEGTTAASEEAWGPRGRPLPPPGLARGPGSPRVLVAHGPRSQGLLLPGRRAEAALLGLSHASFGSMGLGPLLCLLMSLEDSRPSTHGLNTSSPLTPVWYTSHCSLHLPLGYP